jgi:methionine-gamma-lyase
MPIYMTSTFLFDDCAQGGRLFAGEEEGYIYTRYSNPNIDFLGEKIAYLEGAESGVALSSGMAASACLVMALCKSGDRFVSSDPLYGGTFKLFRILEEDYGVRCDLIPADKFESRLSEIITTKHKLVFIETPANPTMTCIDIERAALISNEHGIPLAVDNTFATPVLQRPIELGARLVIHSLTKYMGGHGDIVGGAVAGDRDIVEVIDKKVMRNFGGCISPVNAWLTLRGLKTLALRVRRQSQSAMRIAEFLESHPKVSRIFYPGLPSHPQHKIAKKQMHGGYAGMVAFVLVGGKSAGEALLNHVSLITLAVSLGDTDSLIQHPASMSHATYTSEQLKAAGIDEGLVRFSVGIEDSDDLIADLDAALEMV